MSGYFEALIRAVQHAGLHRPVLVVDRVRMQENLSVIRDGVGRDIGLRLADKSIPVSQMLRQGFDALQTNRVMSFHLPLTAQVMHACPEAEILMGKPMPVEAAARFLTDMSDPGRVTWLVDSAERLAAYRDLAEQTGAALRVAFEVNIGLGRGGFQSCTDLAEACQAAGPLRLCGIMGYEAHIHALPKLLGGGRRAQDKAMAKLSAFAVVLPPDGREIINTGGSSTFLGLPARGVANDMTVGSLMVKPSDFDQSVNAQIQPAAFVVTPVLKTYPHQLPGHPGLTRILHKTGLIRDRIAFVYGGKWMAQPIFPAGLSASPFFSASSNQHGLCLPNGAAEPSHVVFRITQSEAILQHFPEIHVFDGQQITAEWRPFAIC